MVDTVYPLSVLIAITVGWSRMRLSLDSVVPQVSAGSSSSPTAAAGRSRAK